MVAAIAWSLWGLAEVGNEVVGVRVGGALGVAGGGLGAGRHQLRRERLTRVPQKWIPFLISRKDFNINSTLSYIQRSLSLFKVLYKL